jgi:hypothetical protein
MIIKGLVDEDFVNYKKPSMFIAFPYCNWKCEREAGCSICQNSSLANEPNVNIDSVDLVKRYLDNPITQAVVCGGLEPFDSFSELQGLILRLRAFTDDDIVIYTGYTETELGHVLPFFKSFKNIIIKFGRFRPNQESHYDELLGIDLASDNQYARRIS